MKPSLQTERTTVRRLPNRGRYDRKTINAILDEALICHVGFLADGHPLVVPTIHARIDEMLYVHGSAASRMLRSLREGIEICVTVMLLDGLVLARSLFHSSMNYRSVMIFGTAREVADDQEKVSVLMALSEHVCRGRSADARGPNSSELKQTMVLAIPIDEASAKIRIGPPVDDEEDYALPIWAGVLPLVLTPQLAIPDPRLPQGTPVPRYLQPYRR